MARFRKIDPRIWNDEKFRRFTEDGKLAFLFVLTHPHMTSLGAMRATSAGLASELGWLPERMSKALGEAFREGCFLGDGKACFLWARHFIRYNPPESPNVLKAWVGAYDLLPECNLKVLLLQEVKALSEGMGEAFAKAFREAFAEGSRKTMPNPEPEPEPEQEKEQRGSFDLTGIGGFGGADQKQPKEPWSPKQWGDVNPVTGVVHLPAKEWFETCTFEEYERYAEILYGLRNIPKPMPERLRAQKANACPQSGATASDSAQTRGEFF